MKAKYIYITIIVLNLCYITYSLSTRESIEDKQADYLLECYNDSTPAYTKIVSSRLTMLEAQEDSLRMTASNSHVTYSIGGNGNKAFPKYLVKETSTIYNHKQPTLGGFEKYLKK